MSVTVDLHLIEPAHAMELAGRVAGIWCDATGVDLAEAQAFATGTFPKHIGWPGFRMFAAAIDGNMLGFVYGYLSLPGQWWHDQVRSALIAAGHDAYLDNAMELAEIAVLPQFQGRGIGNRLMEGFLDRVAQPVLLAVEASDATAHRLYAGHGFFDLLSDFRYPGWDDRIIIMGRPAPGAPA